MENKKLKLCILTSKHWSQMMGGAQYQIKCLIDSLINTNKFEIYYLTKMSAANYKPVGYKLIKIKGWGLFPRKYFFDFPFVMRELTKIKPDVIYQRVGGAYTGIAAFYAKKKSCRSIWHISHENDVMPRCSGKKEVIKLDWLSKKMLEFGINKIEAIIAQTNYQAKLLKQNYDRSVKAVIPNFHPFPETTINKKCIKIVWVANFKPWKQPEVFIRLAATLNKKNQDLQFLMIGAPSPDQEWQNQLTSQIEKVNNLTYFKQRTIEEVNELLAESHIFINTSLVEGFANTFIQAWMRGVPVVSLHCNPDNILTEKQIGIFAGSFENMVIAVEKMIMDRKYLEKLGKKAQEYAFKRHSLKNTQIIAKILSGAK